MVRAVVLLLTLLSASAALGRGASTTVLGVETSGELALFTTTSSMCRTDGTTAGTICHPFHPLQPPYGKPALLNGKLYTLADRDDQTLYAFDGKSAPGRVFGFSQCDTVEDLTTNGTHLFAIARRFGSGNIDLIRSDGTAAGTVRLEELPSLARIVARAGNAILLNVFENGWWTSDGTPAGTHPILPKTASFLTTVGSIALFSDGEQLWRTDGTTAGTFALMSEWKYSTITVSGGFGYFTIDRQVWRTDGTVAVPLRKVDFDPEVTGAIGTRLLFIERHPSEAVLWSAHDTYGIPMALATIRPQAGFVGTTNIDSAGAFAYFTLGVGPDTQLWRSDGTREGTFRIAKYDDARSLRPFGEKLLFSANNGIHGDEPWITDGTRDGTFLLANLAPEGTLRGRVTDRKTGLPVADAVVAVRKLDYSSAPPDYPPVRTDADGRYVIEGIIGTHHLEAQAPMHRPLLQKVEVDAYEEATLDFELRQGARIVGRIVDPDGRPLRTDVWLSSDVGAPYLLRVNDRGRFESDVLWTEAPWRVEAKGATGHNSAKSGEIRLSPGETREVELTLQPYGRLRVRLIDAITNAQIITTSWGSIALRSLTGAFWIHPISRNADGTIEFAQPDGEYRLHSELYAYQQAFYDSTIRITAGTTQTVDFVLQPRGASIRGVVRDETGARVSNITLHVTRLDGVSFPGARSAHGGTFETPPELPDGRYRLRAVGSSNSPYLPYETELDVRFAANPRPEVDIRLTRGGTLSGRVADARGAPLAGVSVQLTRDRGFFTDVHGGYALNGLPSGTYTVVAKKSGFAETRAAVTITAGEKTKLDLTMREP